MLLWIHEIKKVTMTFILPHYRYWNPSHTCVKKWSCCPFHFSPYESIITHSAFIRGLPPSVPTPPAENLISLFQVVMRFVPRRVTLRPNLPVSSVTAQTTESYSSIPRLKRLSLQFPFVLWRGFLRFVKYTFFSSDSSDLVHKILRNVLFEFVQFNLCICFT